MKQLNGEPHFLKTCKWLVCLAAVVSPALSFASDAFSWSLNSRFRYGVRGLTPGEFATLQHQAVFLSEIQSPGSWSIQLGARLRGDGAYTLNRSRYQDLEKGDPAEFELREANVEYRSENLIFRVGSQVVPWGEAFGSFYADILNPKDLREAGFGDLADLRNPVEMVNLKYIHNDWSLQFVYLPFYRANRLPRPGSDFFPRAISDQLKGLTIDFDQTANPEDENGDLGGRLQFQIKALDISFFGLNYIDRQPISVVGLIGPNNVKVRTRSVRQESYGMTSNWAGDSLVIRSELVRSMNRSFNILGTTLVEPFGQIRGTQDTAVLGLDWPVRSGVLKNWQIGIQYSFDKVSVLNSPLRKSEESVLALQLSKDQEYGASYRLLSGYSISDSSTLLQALVMYPRGRHLSWGFDVWIFAGGSDTQFGSIREGSRFMLVLKGVYSG